jgi:hypothetical protein
LYKNPLACAALLFRTTFPDPRFNTSVGAVDPIPIAPDTIVDPWTCSACVGFVPIPRRPLLEICSKLEMVRVDPVIVDVVIEDPCRVEKETVETLMLDVVIEDP